MQVSVVVQKMNGTGFCAKTISPPLLSVIGPTRDAALSTLRDQLTEQFAEQEFVSLEVPVRCETHWQPTPKPTLQNEPHPWAACAGMFKDHPLMDEVLENMKEYRELRNRELDQLTE